MAANPLRLLPLRLRLPFLLPELLEPLDLLLLPLLIMYSLVVEATVPFEGTERSPF